MVNDLFSFIFESGEPHWPPPYSVISPLCMQCGHSDCVVTTLHTEMAASETLILNLSSGYGISNVALVYVFSKAMKNSFAVFALIVNASSAELTMGKLSHM